MVFEPGQPKPENSGRKPGTPNKNSGAVKNALAEALVAMTPTLITKMAQLPSVARQYGEPSYTDDYIRLLKLMLPHDGAREGIEEEPNPNAPTVPPSA